MSDTSGTGRSNTMNPADDDHIAPQPSAGKLGPTLTAALGKHLDTVFDGRTGTPREILTEVESWALVQDDPAVNQWLWNRQAEANGRTRPAGATSGAALCDHFNQLGARQLSYHQAAHFGVELIHHPDSNRSQVFHTADGDIVFWSEPDNVWQVVNNARPGDHVVSGEMGRKHVPYVAADSHIHHTALVAQTATVEPGARIGPHATVGEHAHIGVDTTVASYARVEDGAFIGSFSSVRDGARIGPGAVIGTGSTIGSTANVSAGARVEQYTHIDAFDNIAANTRIGGSTPRPSRQHNSHRSNQIAAAVDRLAQLDRD